MNALNRQQVMTRKAKLPIDAFVCLCFAPDALAARFYSC